MKTLILIISVLFTLLTNFKSQAAELGPTDVSILMPLPKSENSDYLFRPSSVGKFGEFLPMNFFSQLPKLNLVVDNVALYSQLRALGIRLDPCFPFAPPQTGCQAQIRLVWQPIGQKGSVMAAEDVSVHVFYNLTKAELIEIVSLIKVLNDEFRISNKDLPLDIHPILKRDGLESVYGKRLLSILNSGIGAQRISRVTFMLQTWLGNVWSFGGFDVDQGKMREISIPRIPGTKQTFFNELISTAVFKNAGIDPQVAGTDSLAFLLKTAYPQVPLSRADELSLTAGYLATTRIENPLIHSPNSIDCVGCHLAQQTRIFAQGQYPSFAAELTRLADPSKFKSKYNLSNLNLGSERTILLRSFGYVGSEPAINQRVINETARVLELLEK